jgi:hypothetical protein
MECGEAEMPVVELHRGAQLAADTLLHKMEHARDFDTGDVTHGASGMDGKVAPR